MLNWLANSPVASWVKVAASFVLGAFLVFLTEGNEVTDVDLSDVNVWVSGAIAAALPLVINFLNPSDTRYGRGTGE